MKFRTVLKILYKPMLCTVLFFALFQFLLICLNACGADDRFIHWLYTPPLSSLLSGIAGLTILIPFRDCNRLFTQCGVSRTHAFYAYLCLLPAAVLLTGIQILAYFIIFPESFPNSNVNLGYTFLFSQTSATLYAWSILLSVLRNMALGYLLGAVLYRLSQKFIFLLIPAAAICGYIYFMLIMLYGESGGFGDSLFGTLFFLENMIFPEIALAARDLSATVIFLSVGRLLMRGVPIKS